MIHFELTAREARILSPLKNFEEVTQAIEHRKDPLTRRGVIVIKGRMDYVKKFVESDPDFLGELVQSTLPDCPFCPDAVQRKAPKFTREIAPEGRIQVGEAICFPSLFAHNDYNAIVVPSRSHVLELDQITSDTLVNGFRACLEYFERVKAVAPEPKYPAIVMNFLPPTGSTITHVHMQALASDVPLQATAELLESSRSYFEKHGSSYWMDLIETEKQLVVRYLGEIGSVHWFTPFAPLGLNEAQAVIPDKSSLDQITDDDVEALATGIVKILRFYHDTGVRSFNGAIYSAPLQETENHFSVGFRMVSRYGYKARFVSDIWALQYLLGEREIYESPEETCLKLREYFR